MNNRLLFFFFILILPITLLAQSATNGRQIPTGKIYGRVLDSKTKQPVDYATVALYHSKNDSLITGTLIKSNGDFLIDNIPYGPMRLVFSFMGYKTLEINTTINSANPEQDLGNIRLEPDLKVLNEVIIEGERDVMNVGIDRRTFNVDKDISAIGGTAIDAMKNIPGVSVTADGDVNVRNQSPTIFVDGRPTTLTLEQISSDQIDRIEVITNPSVKFDAASTGGIINIILKKNTRPGYNGVLGVGIGSNDRLNINSSLNVKEGKFGVALGYNFNSAANNVKSYSNRTNLSQGEVAGGFTQNDQGRNARQFNSGRIELEYSPTLRSTFTISQDFRIGERGESENQEFEFFDAAYASTTNGERSQKQKNTWKNYSSRAAFRHNFPRKGKEVVSDITYNKSLVNSNSNFETYNYNSIGQLLPENPELQENISDGSTDQITWQFDFSSPITDSLKIDWGFRTNYRFNKAYSNFNVYDYGVEAFVRDSILSTDYKIDDYVNAAYANLSGNIGRLSYSMGLRFEQTNFTATLLDRNMTFRYLYPDGLDNLYKALFPSIFLSKRYSEKTEFQLNFTRKISRPNFRQVMPFVQQSDRQSYRVGNPNLAPEFFNLMELVANRTMKKGNLLSTLYFRHTEDVITTYVFPYEADSSILVSSFINGNNSFNYGWENIFKRSLTSKMDLTLSGNIFYVNIDASNQGSNLSNAGFSWNAKAILSCKLPKDFGFQVNGSYDAPTYVPQGKTREVYFVDLSLSKNIKRKITMALTVSDVFNTKIFGGTYDTSTFYQDFTRRRDARFIRLNISWRFGESDVSLLRRKGGQRRDGGDMDMDF